MLGCRGKVQRESGVIHLIVEHAQDMTEESKLVSGLDRTLPLVPARSDRKLSAAEAGPARTDKPQAKLGESHLVGHPA